MPALDKVHLSGLRAAEAVARTGSVSAAALDLGISAGAVSQRVSRLEDALGHVLFERSAAGMTPTDLGAEMLPGLEAGFRHLSAAVDLALRDRAHTLTVSVPPVFAGRWLVWRLPRFSERHPDIRVRIDSTSAHVDPNTTDVDLCLRVGRGDWRGVRVDKLWDQRVMPVCSAEVAAKLKTPSDLANVPIIRDLNAMFGWADWLEPEGLDESVLGSGPEYSDGSLCLDAAMSGAGVYLAWETMDLHALAAGRIVAPFSGRHPTGQSYYFVSALDRAPGHAERYFTRWMKDELAADGILVG